MVEVTPLPELLPPMTLYLCYEGQNGFKFFLSAPEAPATGLFLHRMPTPQSTL